MPLSRRVKATLLGTVFAFLVIETGLRIVGQLNRSDSAQSDGALRSQRPVLVFLGNSHTMGAGAPAGKSFPDQLRGLLKKRSETWGTGEPFEIINLGRENANTTFILNSLKPALSQYHPRYAVLMVGEPNNWNHYGYSEYLRSKSPGSQEWFYELYDYLYFFRSFRVIQIVQDLADRYQYVGRTNTESNADERALHWIATIEQGRNIFDPHKMRAPQRNQAQIEIESYLRKNPTHVAALAVLSTLILSTPPQESFDARERALPYLLRILNEYPGQYGFFVDRTFEKYFDLNQLGPVARERILWLRSLRPANYEDLIAFFENRKEPSSHQFEFFREAVRAYPWDFLARHKLMFEYKKKWDWNAVIQTMEEGARLNPISRLGDWYKELANQKADLKRSKFARRNQFEQQIEGILARGRALYPHQPERFEVLTKKDIADWVQSDLLEITELLKRNDVEILLQTYMPKRNGNEHPENSIIRQVALTEGLPLSDTHQFFTQLEPNVEKRRAYYSKNLGDYDDHLGELGYAELAQFLMSELERIGWLSANPSQSNKVR